MLESSMRTYLPLLDCTFDATAMKAKTDNMNAKDSAKNDTITDNAKMLPLQDGKMPW